MDVDSAWWCLLKLQFVLVASECPPSVSLVALKLYCDICACFWVGFQVTATHNLAAYAQLQPSSSILKSIGRAALVEFVSADAEWILFRRILILNCFVFFSNVCFVLFLPWDPEHFLTVVCWLQDTVWFNILSPRTPSLKLRSDWKVGWLSQRSRLAGECSNTSVLFSSWPSCNLTAK